MRGKKFHYLTYLREARFAHQLESAIALICRIDGDISDANTKVYVDGLAPIKHFFLSLSFRVEQLATILSHDEETNPANLLRFLSCRSRTF